MVSVSPITNASSADTNAYSFAPWQTSAPAAAFGTRPAPVQPRTAAPAAVGTAMGLGNQVYNQLPGYQTSLNNIGANVQSETAGQLPQDVTNQITEEAAARGVANGTGSAAVNQDLLRTLGLTSLQLTQMGQQGLDTQLGMLPGAQLYQNPSFYPTTGQNYEGDLQNSIDAAAPDPFSAGNAAIRAAGAGYGVGAGSGGGGLPPTPNNRTSSSVIPGVPLSGPAGGNVNTGPASQSAVSDWLAQYVQQNNPGNPAASETAVPAYEDSDLSQSVGLSSLYE